MPQFKTPRFELKGMDSKKDINVLHSANVGLGMDHNWTHVQDTHDSIEVS